MDGPTARTDVAPARLAARLSPLARSKLLFALAAGLSLAASVAFWFSGDRERGLFVGLWVPSILCAANLLLLGEERRR